MSRSGRTASGGTGRPAVRVGDPSRHRPHAAPREGSAGFTLTELLLVLTVMAVFAVLAAPSLKGAMLRSRTDAALTALRSDLLYTRDRAVATGLRHQFEVDTQTGEVLVTVFRPEELDAQGTAARGAEPDVPLRNRLPDTVRIVEWTVTPMDYAAGAAAGRGEALPLIFCPEGNSDGALLVLEDAEGTRRGIRVDPLTGTPMELDEAELRGDGGLR